MSVLAAVDLNWCLQFIVTVFLVAFGFLHLVKNTASKYFLAQDNDNDSDDVCDWSTRTPATARNSSFSSSSSSQMMTTTRAAADTCAVCGDRTTKKCSGCKMVMYCSEHCQRSHWRSEHKLQCKDFRLSGKSVLGGTGAAGGSSKFIHQSNKILFPYEEFVELFNWDKPGFPPCGLLNCGNSCFANVVLQCLSYTRPLIAFLLEKGHKRECRRNDWCFLCEFQTHVERASQSLRPFSPINILSRLPNIGGNLGYGKQEDAHEFMRFAIDTMQSVCLDEFGGEKAVHPSSQETTLIQHIFGGHLQSQVICTKCNNVSNQYENMMDLTVEIQGDAASLEECLDQFTAKEWLHGDNMYRCDGCNDYVMAWKRLSVRRAPNILTIALKRFQSGRFGKLNKRVTFPETLDLSPYISETGEEDNIYKLYAVIVHVDMLNASFFGHYICYIKDFRGKWYRIDDCKVSSVDIDEVLSQGAYMLLYSRIHARSSCLYPIEPPKEENDNVEVEKVEPSSEHLVQYYFAGKSTDTLVDSVVLPSDNTSKSEVALCEVGSSCTTNSVDAKQDLEMVDIKETSPVSKDGEFSEEAAAHLEHAHRLASGNNASNSRYSSEVDVPQIKPSSAQSNVEDETGDSKSIPLEYSLRRLSNQDSVATQNNVYEKEELEPFSEDTSEVASWKIGLSSTSNSESAKADVEMVDIEESVPVSMDDELYKLPGYVAVEEAADSCGHSCSLVLRNDASTEADDVKMKPPSSLSNAKDGTGGGKSIFRGCSLIHSLNQDSMATQNHVYEGGETPLDISADMSIANEVLEQTEATNSKDKIGTAGCKVPSSNHVQNPARKADGKRSGAKVKPLFPPGFLEKRPQKKYIKRDDKVSAELVGLMSSGNVNCQKDGVARPDLSCQMGAAMTNGDGEHFACHDNGCANTSGMCEIDTRMTTSEFNKPSGFDEPSSLVDNGNTRKPIVLDDSSSVNNTAPVINNRFYG